MHFEKLSFQIYLFLFNIFNMYVRPHLDYGDVIYHIPHKICEFSHSFKLTNQMEKLEAVQYSAALAVTGAWKGTSREKIYEELGWESLNLRRWSRRLVLFYKIINNLTPDYTRNPIPQRQESNYSLRRRATIGQIRVRTERFKSTFYPNCLSEWEKLDTEIRESHSVNSFKKQLLGLIRPPSKSVYGTHDPKRLSILTQLRVGLSKLNYHKFKHNFRDTLNPLCLMVLKIRSTFCCSAIPTIYTDAIFSTALIQYCVLMAYQTFQTKNYCK